jgi:hypothetical protein
MLRIFVILACISAFSEAPAMSQEQLEIQFLPTSCSYLSSFQEKIRENFSKSPGMGYLQGEVIEILDKSDLSEVRKFMDCYEAVKPLVDEDERKSGYTEAIFAEYPFAHVKDLVSQHSLNMMARIYILVKEDNSFKASIFVRNY